MSHENSALLPSNYNDLPREAKKTNDSTFDRIYKHLFNNKTRTELTTEEQAIAARWERAWLYLTRHRTRKQVADLLMRAFDISRATAYDDVANAMRLWGSPEEGVKNAKRAIAEDGILKGMDKAWKSGDLKMHEKYLQQYIELNGLKNEDVANIEDIIKKLIPPPITIVATMDELRQVAEKMRNDIIQDIEYQEANEAEAEEEAD